MHTRAPFEVKSASEQANAVERVMTAFEEFKSTNDARIKAIETKGEADPLTQEKLGRIEQVLAGDEARNQRLTQAEAKAKSAVDQAAELKSQLEALQVKMGRPGALGGAGQTAGERKARVNDWARAVHFAATKGEVNLDEVQRKALDDTQAEYKTLGVSNDADGGYLAPAEFVAEIIKNVTEISPVRSLARLRTTANSSVKIPRRTAQFSAKRSGELDARSETKGLKYGLIEVAAPEMYAIIDISNQMLEDAAFDMQAELQLESTEQFARLEGTEFVSGSGVDSMEGILVNKDVGFTVSGHATTVRDATGQADGILKLFYDVKTAYSARGSWALNRTVLGSVRTLKDGQGRYLWTPGIADKQANTINGAPYVECPDMPNEGAGNFPIAFGDFLRAYTIVDRVAMTMLRDPFTQAAQGAVRFWFRRRTGGMVTQAEAIRKLKCSA